MTDTENQRAGFAAIIGEDEAATGVVTLRDLRSDRPQEQVSMENLVETIKTDRSGNAAESAAEQH